MGIKERELFEAYMAEKYKNLVDRRRCLNNGGGYMAWDMNVAWQVWQAKAQAVPEGFVLINAESLAFHAKSIRMFNDGDSEHQREEIEDHVCSIEAMIEALEPTND